MTNEEFIESIKLEGEEWRPVVGWEDYYMVSSFGRVMRKFTSKQKTDRHDTVVTAPRLLNPTIRRARKQRYFYVTLSALKTRKKVLVHRMVAFAFVSNPLNKPEIDHIDGNGLNNVVTNLRWCTRTENNMNPIARKRQSEAHIGKKMTTLWKPVVCISKYGVVTHYKSMSEANKDGYRNSSIIDSIKHPNRPVRKRKWMYLSDFLSCQNSNVNELSPIQ